MMVGQDRGRLNALYDAYCISKSETDLNALLADVERYARYVTRGRGGKYRQMLSYRGKPNWSTEVSQKTAIKVWENLWRFDASKGEFKHWVWAIAQQTASDEAKRIFNRHELGFLEPLGYGEARIDGDGRVLLLSRYSSDRQEELSYRLDKLVENLSGDDRFIIVATREGYKPSAIAEFFERNDKWAYNRIQKIKIRLRRLAGVIPKVPSISYEGEEPRHGSEPCANH